ncbi:MAG: hypothetical protein ING84_12410 [Cytophagales bacterium]|nr:hypothetical protein [Cytophagales bacterium]MCA6368294.1 hypothetical protein [Cytophagales bacterium]MCA6371110.1 hypothetical protein [Cytophagales bacterium]MCA6377453.1 hypothetical protein [Cytophagales bacterium]MCA6382945.1 hypothetical protein [Cytophagales bacterium]
MGAHAPERQAEHRAFATRQPSARQPQRSEGWAQTDRSIPAAVDGNNQLILPKRFVKSFVQEKEKGFLVGDQR